MSICRWSSDGFQCDLYVYEDLAGGWTVHVAGNRYERRIPDLDVSSVEAFRRSRKAANEAREATALAPIGLPHDGETFREPTLEATIARVQALIDAGYQVPSWVMNDLHEEVE